MKKLKFSLLLSATLLMMLGACKKDKQELLAGNPAASTTELNTPNEGNVCGAANFNDGAASARMQEMEQKVQAYIANNPGSGNRAAAAIVTIPVVFHVLYNLPEQ